MRHNIFNLTVTPNAEGISLELVSTTGGTIKLSGSFDKIYPIVDTIMIGFHEAEEETQMEYTQ